ncbi:MAG: Uma2 family endonuclease [Chloroflexota bacterium]
MWRHASRPVVRDKPVDPLRGNADVLWLVEVADSSRDLDRRWKIPLDARAAIREVWLVDLSEDTLTVDRAPSADGYQASRVVHRGEWVSPLAYPGREIAVVDVLG